MAEGSRSSCTGWWEEHDQMLPELLDLEASAGLVPPSNLLMEQRQVDSIFRGVIDSSRQSRVFWCCAKQLLEGHQEEFSNGFPKFPPMRPGAF